MVRLSGPRAHGALAALGAAPPPPRVAALRRLHDPLTGELLDHALVLAFAAPASATGEDVVELHLHGGPAVITAVIAALGGIAGLRLAERGEFSRRAFDNGKLDLSRAEGLADLVEAETEVQRRAALAQAGGGLARVADGWRAQLVEVLASVEAELDFADDEPDVGNGLATSDGHLLAALRAEMHAVIEDAVRGQRIRDGLSVAVVGAPNTGKSSIINRLARRDIAIVSPYPGTTRDLVELPLDLRGIAVTLVDTAGLRDSADPVEREGIRRARVRAAAADLVLHVVADAGEGIAGQIVRNKIDLTGAAPGIVDGVIQVSAATGAGFDAFERWLGDWAHAAVRPGEAVLITQARHQVAMTQALASIDEAIVEADAALRAEALRLASRRLAVITGRIDVEDILDAIFSRFCIGK